MESQKEGILHSAMTGGIKASPLKAKVDPGKTNVQQQLPHPPTGNAAEKAAKAAEEALAEPRDKLFRRE